MSRFSKLHETIVTSSIWNEDDKTRIVWVTMLAMKDRRGYVAASVDSLAHSARVSLEACQAALAKFTSPDEFSRTKSDEGRRIRVVDGGWMIINHRKYSSVRDDDKRREQNRLADERRRKRAKEAQATTSAEPTSSPETAPVKLSQTQPNSAKLSQEPLFTLENSAALSKPLISAEKERAKRLPTSEAAKRIAAMFSRRLSTAWSVEEIAKFKDLGTPDPADLDLLESYYRTERAKGDEGRHRRDLKTFLNNYPGELDRARAAAPKGKSPNHEDPAGWREWLAANKTAYTPHRLAMDFLKQHFAKSQP